MRFDPGPWAPLPAALLLLMSGPAAALDLCQQARASVTRLAAEQEWQIDVQCRTEPRSTARSEPEFVAVDTDRAPALRAGALSWPLKVLTSGKEARIHWVPLQVRLRSRAWVATRDLTPGEPIGHGDLDLRWHEWAAGERPQPTADGSPPQGRVARRVRMGQPLSAHAVTGGDAAQLGDPVTLVLVQGPLEVQVPARLLSAAKVGQQVKVQPLGRNEVLVGRLSSPSLVTSWRE